MQVILLEKVENLGDIGTEVDVRAGYARNYLIPKHKALPLTPENMQKIVERRAELEAEAGRVLASAMAYKEKLEGQTLILPAKAGPEGRLFGSIGPQDIVDRIEEVLGITLERRHIRLAEGPIRGLGDEEVTIHLHTDVEVKVVVRVVAED
ncbi:MAG: 50S ribosomal protein L9 [Gammaproteobacteria bacterium]